MGSTMRAAIQCCRNRGASEITVAAPVASPRVAAEMETVAERVVVLLAPPHFRAVAEAYRHWHDVTDEEAVALLEKVRTAAKRT